MIHMILMYSSWVLTGICSLLAGLRVLGYDVLRPYSAYQQTLDVLFGLAGAVSLAFFVLQLMQ